jgi:hypothetical protein
MRAVLVLVLAACGSAPPNQAPAPATPATNLPPLPRSSIAAVLLHRQELALTDEQVRAMQDIDERLAEVNAKVAEGPTLHRIAPDAGTPQSGLRMTGMGGRGSGGSHGGYKPDPPPQELINAQIEKRQDENDTRSYLRAEQVLTEEQRAKAREYAEQYREALYDRRHPHAIQNP